MFGEARPQLGVTPLEVADMGGGPVFYSTLAQIEKVADLPTSPVDSAVRARAD